MRASDPDELLRYYQEELAYLRRAGADFARRHPQVAALLDLAPHEAADPHVERLLEGFAFLTARLQWNADRALGEVAAQLLSALYPHYVCPTPSLAIARFEPGPAPLAVPRGTPLFARLPAAEPEGLPVLCRFRTCSPLQLWPVEVVRAELLPPDESGPRRPRPRMLLRLGLRALGGASLAALAGLDRLRFYVHADPLLAGCLHGLLSCPLGVRLVPDHGGTVAELGDGAVLPVGFAPEEGLFPAEPLAHPAYRLLQEYFAFPEKFRFFDVVLGAHGFAGAHRSCDLVFELEDPDPATPLDLPAGTFALHCVPVVNLFERTTEPVRIDQQRIEYPLEPDSRRPASTEIHSILAVEGVGERAVSYQPFYSFRHAPPGAAEARTFWHARRVPSPRPGVAGSEMLLSLIDVGTGPALPPPSTVYARTLCTNRTLAARLRAGDRLESDELPDAGIRLLTRPTPQADPPRDRESLWRLVSHLSLNHLSLDPGAGGEEEGPAALRELLGLYAAGEGAAARRQIEGIVGLSCRRVVRPFGDEPRRAFCRGTEVTLVLAEEGFAQGAMLFAAVLHRFFALYAAAGSFVELVLERQGRPGMWRRWPPLAGRQWML